MAIIVGGTSAEEIRALQEAGYRFATLDTIRGLLKLGNVTGVWVDCDITGLLSPPLCKFCGRLMETHSDIDSVNCWDIEVPRTDSDVVHICPSCGAWVQVCTHPPKE